MIRNPRARRVLSLLLLATGGLLIFLAPADIGFGVLLLVLGLLLEVAGAVVQHQAEK